MVGSRACAKLKPHGSGRSTGGSIAHITAATISAHQNKNARQLADLVVLIGQDHSYAPAVRRLRLLGVPTWVRQPGRFIAADLCKAAAAVIRLALPVAA